MSEESGTNRYAILLTAVFLVICGFAISRHEMWRDEIQAWLVARDSASLLDLFRNLKYEGHQELWYLVLMPLTRISTNPAIMQIVHLLTAGTTVYLTARYAPFTRLQKFLIAFGYFYGYEYALISRNYALGVLFITLFCILYAQRRSHFLAIGGVLFLLSQTNPHCLIIAMITAAALLPELMGPKRNFLTGPLAESAQVRYGVVLIAIGIGTAILQLPPPADSGYAVGWHWDFDPGRLKHVINLVSEAYLPLPVPSQHFWGTHWLEQAYTFRSWQTAISLVLLAVVSLTLLRSPVALFIFLAGTSALLLFFYIKFFGSMRHHGFLFILLLMAVWIQRSSGPQAGPPGARRHLPVPGWHAGSLQQHLLTGILLFQLAGGAIALTMDVRHAFSFGKAAADYIVSRGMQDMLLVGDIDAPVSTIVGYLGKGRAYYLRSGHSGSFVVWNKARLGSVSDEEAVRKAGELADDRRENVLLVLNRALGRDLIDPDSMCMLAGFTGSIIGDEDFYLYLVRPQDGNGSRWPPDACNGRVKT